MVLNRRLGILDGMYNRANYAHHLSYLCPLERNAKNCVLVTKGMFVCPPKYLIWDFLGANFKYCF